MLYNIKKSFATHHIHEDGHKIYFEEYGKKMVFLYYFSMEVQGVDVTLLKDRFSILKNLGLFS